MYVCIVLLCAAAADMIEVDAKRTDSTSGLGSSSAVRLTIPARKKSACC